jgi:DNA uptake protein ComE-like DNA-binding protein
MKHRIAHFLHYTKRERNGTIILLGLMIMVYALPNLYLRLKPIPPSDFSRFQAAAMAWETAKQTSQSTAGKEEVKVSMFDPNLAAKEEFMAMGISEKVAATICNYRNKGGKFKKSEDFKKIWGLEPEDFDRLEPYLVFEKTSEASEKETVTKPDPVSFAFDPNTVSAAEMALLGLPKHTIKSIKDWQEKGWRFKTKADFKRLYTLEEEDYIRLESNINIATVESAPAADAPRPAAYSGGSVPTKKYNSIVPVDINRSPVEAWMMLPGIGEKRAAQIINFRERLGGFISMEQVGELYGLPDSTFQKIKPHLRFEFKGIHKINLNTVTSEDLAKHPYFSKKQAARITDYRKQNGNFNSLNDLSKIIALGDAEWMSRVSPYLSVE